MAAVHSLHSGVLALADLRLEEVFLLQALLADTQMHVQGESGYKSLGQ